MPHPKLETFKIGPNEPAWFKDLCKPFVDLAHEMDRTLPDITGTDGKDEFFATLLAAMHAAVRVELTLRRAREAVNGSDWPGGVYT